MPGGFGVGEYTDEGLLGVENPSEGNEDCLEELRPVEVADAFFDCVVEGWWWFGFRRGGGGVLEEWGG